MLKALQRTLAAAVMIVAVAPADASPIHSIKLAPPVIHESFSVLPCAGVPGHRSTLEEEGCAEQEILRGDVAIDALNESIFAKLAGDPARLQFIAGHNAWIAYRHAYCLSMSDVFEGGTEAGVINAQCAANLTIQHIKDLRGFVGDLRSDG